MAEIVGLVASSIALAQVVGKIGGGVLKLKRMWDEVKDVPEAIQDLFKRLDLILPMVARIARDIETGATLFEDMEAVESCILSCQQIDATKRARRVRDIVRVALKRDVLERHEKKLEGMIQILLLAHSEYSRACTKAIPTAIVQHLSASGYVAKQRRGEKNDVEERDLSLEPWRKQNGLSTYRGMSLPSSTLELPWKGQSFFGSFTSASRTSQIVHGSSKYEITERAFRLQPPRWLAQQAWELRVLSGWQLHFRAYNFVPDRSPAFISVVCGDMNTLLRLFKGGKASPFDVFESGSLMHEAWRFGRLRIIRTLVQLGVCMSHQDLLHATYGLANMGVQSDSLCDIEKARHVESFRHCLQSLRHIRFNMKEETFAFLLWHDGVLCPADIDHVRSQGCSFIHLASRISFMEAVEKDLSEARSHFFHGYRWGQSIDAATSMRSWRTWTKSKSRESARSAWKRRRSEIIRLTADWHLRYGGSILSIHKDSTLAQKSLRSLILTILDGCRQIITYHSFWTLYKFRDGKYHHWTSVPTVRLMTLTLQSWLEDVNESGINLTSYGREELEIIKSTTSDREYQYGPLRLRPLDHDDCIPRVPKATDTTDCCRFPRLETFTYGPSPGDWTFTWDWGTEEFAGEFWAAIETPAISISGAWIEEQCYDYELYEDNFEKFLPEKEEDDPYEITEL